MSQSDAHLGEIAVIGMACRFPGAGSVEALWENLRDGVESITFFSDAELLESGVDPALVARPDYVKARPLLDGADLFDSAFFGINPREASLMDPQHRVFLECCWEGLESAGYDAARHAGAIGVFAGASFSTYLINLFSNPELVELVGLRQILLGNDKDYLATRVSFKLDLRGPSLSVQTACSTSLVAVHLACQSLLNHECGIALAGGVSVGVPQREGYLYQAEGIVSPDGHCRAFDARARGTIGGDGAGVVVLKRLAEALADGDTIRAVVKGSAINNDGAAKQSYTAPSLQSQSRVIAEALAVAGVPSDTVTLVEAHGTGTPLGDPIEIAALTRAFRAGTEEKGFCAVGSVKTNFGHLDAAAGVAGLIKAVLALEHRQLPPSLHFEHPNPAIDFAASPFFVNSILREWPPGKTPRRAGVSSMGIGGTNAHLLVEEAPPELPSAAAAPCQLLLLSARTAGALEIATANLAAHLESHPHLELAAVAHTTQAGRKELPHRRMVVCGTAREAAELLRSVDPKRVATALHSGEKRSVAFLFPGQGTQHVGMGRELYRHQPVFRREVDRAAELLRPHLGRDVRELLFPAPREAQEAAWLLGQTAFAQPVLFAVEYALARLWMDLGIEPEAMLGHSVGEYVAACLAEVFRLEDALSLVAARGRLMQELPPGAMLAVPLSAEELGATLDRGLAIAAVNGPSQCVVSGEEPAIAAFQSELAARGLESRRLHTSHAFHSAMMEPILDEFGRLVAAACPRPPRRRYAANLTGAWATAEQAQDPGYWTAHLRQGVRFADGLARLLEEPGAVLLEVGPGEALTRLARRHPSTSGGPLAVASWGRAGEEPSDLAHLLRAAGRLWLAGVRVDWTRLHQGRRRRVPLPTYPFERERHWVERRRGSLPTAALPPEDAGLRQVADWFYLPAFRPAPAPAAATPPAGAGETWLVCLDGEGLGALLAARLEDAGQRVVTVALGDRFARLGPAAFAVAPGCREDFSVLLAEVRSLGVRLDRILHLWGVAPLGGEAADPRAIPAAEDRGFYSLLFLVQALAERPMPPRLDIGIVAHGLLAVNEEEETRPERATVLALAKILPQEYPGVVCHSLDVALPQAEPRRLERLADQVLAELRGGVPELAVAFRGGQRWVQELAPVHLAPAAAEDWLEIGGTYLIVGGFGRIGRVIARQIAAAPGARLFLIGRKPLPPRAGWEAHLENAAAADETARRIRQVLELEGLGATVLPRAADAADREAMSALVEEAHLSCARIHGVIHLAGDAGEERRSVQELTREECAAQMRAKVAGVLALAAALAGRAPGFCLLFSSLSSILGGLGMAAYAAANLFLDELARNRARRTGERWISIDWDAWRFTPQAERGPAAGPVEPGVTPDSGADALARIVARGGAPQIVVSASALAERLDRWVRLQSLRQEAETAPRLHARRNLATPYAAPRNELEETLAAIWQELLGIEQVGIHDDFFELGGHSLLAIQLKSRLRDAFEVEPPLRVLFEKPTIADLAAAIESELIEHLEGLSEEETAAQLESGV